MMGHDLLKILVSSSVATGAGEPFLKSLIAKLGLPLPSDYFDFLRCSNGYEGKVGQNGYLVLWPAEKVLESNVGCGTAEFAPGLVLIGTNGSNAGYALDLRDAESKYVEVDLIGLSLDDIFFSGSSLQELLHHISA